jgi:hypothetical protein
VTVWSSVLRPWSDNTDLAIEWIETGEPVPMLMGDSGADAKVAQV